MEEVSFIICFGIEFRRLSHKSSLITLLDAIVANPSHGSRNGYSVIEAKTITTGTDWEIITGKQDGRNITEKKKFKIKIAYDRDAFLSGLENKGAIVIYDGHSRHGQGPAFTQESGNVDDCTNISPNPWGTHIRMGYDAVEVPCKGEILNHGTNPLQFNTDRMRGKRVSSGINHMIASKRKKSIQRDFPEIAQLTNCKSEKTLLNRSYWRKNYEDDLMTIVQGGHEDLDKSELKCSCLFLNSCSSFQHFYLGGLRGQRKKMKSKCKFYVTKKIAYMANSRCTNIFFERVVLFRLNPVKETKKMIKLLNGMNAEFQRIHKIKNVSGLVIVK